MRIGLQFHGIRNERACWTIGNRLLGLVMLDINLTRLDWDDFTWSRSDIQAERAWQALQALLRDAMERELFRVRYIRFDKIAQKTLEKMPFDNMADEIAKIPEGERTPELIKEIRAKNQAIRELERTRRTSLTSEQAAEIFLGPIQSSELLDQQIEKQKGRYRLTEDEIKQRKNIVNKAEEMRSNTPGIKWKAIALELDVPERTLRDWRHNPTYK